MIPIDNSLQDTLTIKKTLGYYPKERAWYHVPGRPKKIKKFALPRISAKVFYGFVSQKHTFNKNMYAT